MSDDLQTYLDGFKKGDALSASRLMTIVERGGGDAERVLDQLFPSVGNAIRVAVTGSTGSGKSTLVDAMTPVIRARDLTLGVVAEDPTSPFSGGAILGDRIRMGNAIADNGTFVRSIASRGSETGFSDVATELADVLDAFGLQVVLMETIGVGQLEHRIRYSADTTVVVLTPEAGDDVQSLKSGLMEVGDIFVVNKSDRPGADRYAGDIKTTLDIRYHGEKWVPPVIMTTATKADGADALVGEIFRHREHLEASGLLENRRAEGLRRRVEALTTARLGRDFWGNSYIQGRFSAILGEVTSGTISPYAASLRLAESFRIDEA